MDGGGTNDIVDGALGARSVIESIVGIVVGGVNGGCLGRVAAVSIDELGEREHGALSADAWRGEIGGHGCAGCYQARS